MNKFNESWNKILNRKESLFGVKFTVRDLLVNLPTQENLSHDVALMDSLVDKATPKKPIEKKVGIESFNEDVVVQTYYVCGCETFSQVNHQDRFCPKCGQAIDWSEDE